MKSDAEIGYGTTLELALATTPSVRQFIAEAKKHTPPGFSANFVDVTHMHSPSRMREFVPGLGDAGSSSHEMNHVAGSTTDAFLRSARAKPLVAWLTLPNGRQIIYACAIEEDSGEVPLDDAMTSTLSLKVSGQPTVTDPTAPRAVVEPAITGVAQVGVPLQVDEGAWAGVQEFTYQWRGDGVAIDGATGLSYVPVAGDVGDVITCSVTGANAAFSTTVVTAGTTAVIAAA